MSLQAAERIIWLGKRFRRGDSGSLLAAAMLALLVLAPAWNLAAAPASGTSLASTQVSEAMLWWLQSSLSTTPGAPSNQSSVAALLAEASAARVADDCSVSLSPTVEADRYHVDTQSQPISWQQTSYASTLPPVDIHTATTSIRVASSGTVHAAAFRSGIRTNRSLE